MDDANLSFNKYGYLGVGRPDHMGRDGWAVQEAY